MRALSVSLGREKLTAGRKSSSGRGRARERHRRAPSHRGAVKRPLASCRRMPTSLEEQPIRPESASKSHPKSDTFTIENLPKRSQINTASSKVFAFSSPQNLRTFSPAEASQDELALPSIVSMILYIVRF